MGEKEPRVAIITGGSQGIGAGLVAAYRRQGWAVVANSRTVKPSEDPDVLTVDGDIAEPTTTDRIIGEALERFGSIDTLVNNAGLYIGKPFTDYTAEDYHDPRRVRELQCAVGVGLTHRVPGRDPEGPTSDLVVIGRPGSIDEVDDNAHLPATAVMRTANQLAARNTAGTNSLTARFTADRPGTYPVFLFSSGDLGCASSTMVDETVGFDITQVGVVDIR